MIEGKFPSFSTRANRKKAPWQSSKRAELKKNTAPVLAREPRKKRPREKKTSAKASRFRGCQPFFPRDTQESKTRNEKCTRRRSLPPIRSSHSKTRRTKPKTKKKKTKSQFKSCPLAKAKPKKPIAEDFLSLEE